MQFTYKIINVDSSGLAEIKYNHEKYGSVIRRFYLPFEKGENAVEQEILYRVPRDHYRAMARKQNEEVQKLIQNFKNKEGSLEANIADDGFFDTTLR